MTRKGCKQRAWTMAEIRYLLSNAGEIPIEDIAATLDRSVAATREQWRRHKQEGATTRVLDRRLICQSCYRKRFYFKGDRCLVCLKTEQKEKGEQRVSEALRKLPHDIRAHYAKQETKRGSRPVRPPRKPKTTGMTKKEKTKADLQYYKQLEAAYIGTLQREINSNKKRLERIRRKMDANPRKKRNGSSDDNR